MVTTPGTVSMSDVTELQRLRRQLDDLSLQVTDLGRDLAQRISNLAATVAELEAALRQAALDVGVGAAAAVARVEERAEALVAGGLRFRSIGVAFIVAGLAFSAWPGWWADHPWPSVVVPIGTALGVAAI